jgi:hypothetical protein
LLSYHDSGSGSRNWFFSSAFSSERASLKKNLPPPYALSRIETLVLHSLLSSIPPQFENAGLTD